MSGVDNDFKLSRSLKGAAHMVSLIHQLHIPIGSYCGWAGEILHQLGAMNGTRWCPPSYVCYFVIPMNTIDITPIHQPKRYSTYVHQLS